jgi:hypothetical protein
VSGPSPQKQSDEKISESFVLTKVGCVGQIWRNYICVCQIDGNLFSCVEIEHGLDGYDADLHGFFLLKHQSVILRVLSVLSVFYFINGKSFEVFENAFYQKLRLCFI